MLQAYGLYTHIAANRIKSLILLASFIVLLQVLILSFSLVINAFQSYTLGEALALTLSRAGRISPIGFGIAALWFIIAWFAHGRMIAAATGARNVTRQQAPKLHTSLENLCISRGIPMPQLQIIETPALNAFSSGISPDTYRIAVTRGLLDTLSDRELQAVLGHELTHIRNKDTQMMVVAAIFAGIFAFVGDMTFRNWDLPWGSSPRWPASSRDKKDNSGVIIIAVVIALGVIAVSWGVSTLVRFAISRSREFMADAGSVELTKDPDAMISALRKIAGHAAIPDMPSRMHAFFIETPAMWQVSSFVATHPSIDDRIAALVKYAGGRDAIRDAMNVQDHTNQIAAR
jgi:heat shock protein HtpX